jgi:uncharacterized protein YndB with AHSA1/START domain
VDHTTTRADSPGIERTIHIEADPATVFRYWTEHDLLVRWMGRTATIEPRPGGAFRLDYNGTDIVSGTILEVTPAERLVLTWGWEAAGDNVPPGSSRVEVVFVPDGNGTTVTVRHLDLPSDSIEGHATGWDHFLPQLATALAGR